MVAVYLASLTPEITCFQGLYSSDYGDKRYGGQHSGIDGGYQNQIDPKVFRKL